MNAICDMCKQCARAIIWKSKGKTRIDCSKKGDVTTGCNWHLPKAASAFETKNERSAL